MSERRRMSRALRGGALWPRVGTVIIDGPRPPAQNAAVFAREDVGAAVTLLDVTPTAPVMTLETLRAMERLIENAPKPSAVIRTPWRADDDTTPEERAAAQERRAVERTGRVLVAWLIGRWRR